MKKCLYKTLSFCPECLAELTADILEEDGMVYMEKSCREHGRCKTVIWEAPGEAYLRWMAYGGIDTASLPQTEEELLRTEGYHCQNASCNGKPPVTAALMVTGRCNLHCPVCFTKPLQYREPEPDFDALCRLLDAYREKAGEGAPLEFCGGEPTVRDDLPALASYAREKGFDYIQLNTNGLRLAQEAAYCRRLTESGITTVYLGFDGFSEDVYRRKYGADLRDSKNRAVINAGNAGLSVVLVPCVMPGVNDGQLGDIIRYAGENMPAVKGVYFQPLSYFGLYDGGEKKRLTIPGLIRRLEAQTGGEIDAEDFLPGNCEHPVCSFQAVYMRRPDGRLAALTHFQEKQPGPDNWKRVREHAKSLWGPKRQNLLSIGGMAFQDAWNYDSMRVGACTIQIIGRKGELVPLCAKYLTSTSGRRIPAADV